MSESPDLDLGPEDLQRLREEARGLGLLRLGAVDLEHPGFRFAHDVLHAHLDAAKEGEMKFMTRTREVRVDPAQMLPGARSVLVAVVPYRGVTGPVARYAQSSDYHTQMHRRLARLCNELAVQRPAAETLVCVDTKPLLERSAAVLAGLGFIGKSGCLIVPGLGSMVFIGAILTTLRWTGPDAAPAELTTGASAPWDACGSCTACLDACPTSAFDAPGDLDPRRCVSYLTIEHRSEIDSGLREQMGVRIAGCDVCQEVCPYNHGRSRDTKVADNVWLPRPGGRERTPDLPRLVNIGSNQHRQFVKGTALNRIPRRVLRRNAIIATGHIEGALSEAERNALAAAERGSDLELASLATWALRRRGE